MVDDATRQRRIEMTAANPDRYLVCFDESFLDELERHKAADRLRLEWSRERQLGLQSKT